MSPWSYVAAALIVALAVGVAVRTSRSHRLMQSRRALSEHVADADRFVDIGVRLHVVVQDAAGTELLSGKPKLRILRTHDFGGILDTKATPPRLVQVGSLDPQVWYCSEDQEQVILHGDDTPLGQLVYGSEGAGKTTALVMWNYLRWLEAIDAGGERQEAGVSAPTHTRLELVTQEFFKLLRPTWYRYAVADGIITLCDGYRIRLKSTYRQSAAQGSPIQGFNACAWSRDEGQDQIDVHADIEMRLRSARGGKPKQLITATAKDNPEWRTFRDTLDRSKRDDGSPLWIRRTLLGRRSPFIAASFWDDKRSSMSAREFRRRVDAQDVGPERATYPSWDRNLNLIPYDELNWVDVTEHELRIYGPNRALQVGHDPGALWDVSLLAKAYVHRRDLQAYQRGTKRPFWLVRGEVNTEMSTTAHHLVKLLEHVRKTYQINLLTHNGQPNPHGRQMLVRADPSSKKEHGTDRSIYTQFSNAGIHIKPAVYNAEGTGHGKVPVDAGIEVVNTLLCAESGERRLFVERLPNGAPAAPKLVNAIESQERDTDGKAESQRKGTQDTSHWTAALRYLLWAIERPRLQLVAREEA